MAKNVLLFTSGSALFFGIFNFITSGHAIAHFDDISLHPDNKYEIGFVIRASVLKLWQKMCFYLHLDQPYFSGFSILSHLVVQ